MISGIHSFYQDSKAYYKVTTGLWKDEKLTQFTRYELENYRQVIVDSCIDTLGVVLFGSFSTNAKEAV